MLAMSSEGSSPDFLFDVGKQHRMFVTSPGPYDCSSSINAPSDPPYEEGKNR